MEIKKPRGRPATGRKETKQLNLKLTLEQYNKIGMLAERLQLSRTKTILRALELLEEK